MGPLYLFAYSIIHLQLLEKLLYYRYNTTPVEDEWNSMY